MSRHDRTSQLIDAVLRYAVVPGVLVGGLALPGLLIGLEKPLDKLLKGMDRRERERELRRVLGYMKSQKLIADNYRHGLKLTRKGRQRLDKLNIGKLSIHPEPSWDGRWRLIFYDIPEKHKYGRNTLALALRRLGCHQLQKSVWIHPLPCKEVVLKICVHYELEKYVTYTDCLSIDNQAVLIDLFKKKLPKTKF